MTEEGSHPPKCAFLHRMSDGYEKAMLKVQAKVERAVGAVGAFDARRPVLIIVVSILLTGLAGAGWARFRIESSGDKLW